MTTDNSSVIHIYADGAASPNPGKGGYGVVIIKDGQRQELSCGYRHTTNNRMEILGAIAGLKHLNGSKSKVILYSDSQYLVNSFNSGHAEKWRNKGWMFTRNKPVKNPDLWNELLNLAEPHEVKMVWVKGHQSNVENTRCDELAVMARQAVNLAIDEGYENPLVPDILVIPEKPEPTEPTFFDLFR